MIIQIRLDERELVTPEVHKLANDIWARVNDMFDFVECKGVVVLSESDLPLVIFSKED